MMPTHIISKDTSPKSIPTMTGMRTFLGSTTTGIAVLLLITTLALYLGQRPPPTMSEALVSWRTKGTYFLYKDYRLFYRDSPAAGNPATAPALICLHGFPSLSYDWVKMWPSLVGSTAFSRVIAMDFLGFGFSDKPLLHNYTIMEQADFYEALLNDLKVKVVHILAHDYGDTVGQELVARYNARKVEKQQSGITILSICLLNGGIFPETNFPRPVQKLMTVPLLGQLFARLSNQYIFSKGFSDVFGPNTKPSETDLADFYAAIRISDGHLVLPNLLDYIAQRSYNKERWTNALQMTSVSVNVIWGLADPVNPPGFVDFYKETVPYGKIKVLEDREIGHYPQWEDYEAVTRAFLHFITHNM